MYRMKVITALKSESKDVARALKMYVVGEEDARRSREVDLRLVQQLGASMGFWYVRRIVFTIAPANEAALWKAKQRARYLEGERREADEDEGWRRAGRTRPANKTIVLCCRVADRVAYDSWHGI